MQSNSETQFCEAAVDKVEGVSFCFVEDVFLRALFSAIQISSGWQTGFKHKAIMSSQDRLRFWSISYISILKRKRKRKKKKTTKKLLTSLTLNPRKSPSIPWLTPSNSNKPSGNEVVSLKISDNDAKHFIQNIIISERKDPTIKKNAPLYSCWRELNSLDLVASSLLLGYA